MHFDLKYKKKTRLRGNALDVLLSAGPFVKIFQRQWVK